MTFEKILVFRALTSAKRRLADSEMLPASYSPPYGSPPYGSPRFPL